MDMNSGYAGWSMSKQALVAYRNGERPRSKWNRSGMLTAIKRGCENLGLRYEKRKTDGMSREKLFYSFFSRSSWHHTGKLCLRTDFYALDPDKLEKHFHPLTAAERMEEKRHRAQERKEKSHEGLGAPSAWDARVRAERAYTLDHGYAPNTFAALADARPDLVYVRFSQRSGKELLCFIDPRGQEQSCLLEDSHARSSGDIDVLDGEKLALLEAPITGGSPCASTFESETLREGNTHVPARGEERDHGR